MRRYLFLRAGLILSVALPMLAADWPQWRGPNRDGISTETGLLKEWPSNGPPLVWKVQSLGEGYSSPAIANGRIYTQFQRGNETFVIALDEATGKTLWQVRNGGSFRESRGNGPRGTPTVEGSRLYALSADGTLSCLEAADGKVVWSKNILREFNGSVPRWGISESPLIDGNRLIVIPGGSAGAVVALDKRNGAVLWKSQSEPAGYSSVMPMTVGGVRSYVAFTGRGVLGLSADTGELFWRYDRAANRTANVATPIVRDGHVFVSSDYGTGCALLKVEAQDKKLRASEVYFSREMRNHHASSVLIGDYLYGFSSAILTAMNFLTGEVAWRDRSVGKGSVTFADGHLYCFSETGVMGLVEAKAAGYREKSRFRIGIGGYHSWTPPVIANGRLYLRDQENLYCYDIQEKR